MSEANVDTTELKSPLDRLAQLQEEAVQVASQQLAGELVDNEDNDAEAQFEVPRLLEPPEGKTKRWTLQFFADGCFDCNALVKGAEVEGKELPCHYSAGHNQHCPAEVFRIKFVGPVVLMVRKYRKLLDGVATNPTRRAGVYAKLSNELMDYSQEDQAEIMGGLGL